MCCTCYGAAKKTSTASSTSRRKQPEHTRVLSMNDAFSEVKNASRSCGGYYPPKTPPTQQLKRVKMKKLVEIKLTIPLRDYASFEDLATELGIKATDVKIVEGAPTAKKHRVISRTRHVVTPAAVRNIKAFKKKNPLASVARIKTKLQLPYGHATISRILNGYRDNLLK